MALRAHALGAEALIFAAAFLNQVPCLGLQDRCLDTDGYSLDRMGWDSVTAWTPVWPGSLVYTRPYWCPGCY